MDLQEPSNEPQIWRQRRVMGGVDCQMSDSAEAKREQGDNCPGARCFQARHLACDIARASRLELGVSGEGGTRGARTLPLPIRIGKRQQLKSASGIVKDKWLSVRQDPELIE